MVSPQIIAGAAKAELLSRITQKCGATALHILDLYGPPEDDGYGGGRPVRCDWHFRNASNGAVSRDKDEACPSPVIGFSDICSKYCPPGYNTLTYAPCTNEIIANPSDPWRVKLRQLLVPQIKAAGRSRAGIIVTLLNGMIDKYFSLDRGTRQQMLNQDVQMAYDEATIAPLIPPPPTWRATAARPHRARPTAISVLRNQAPTGRATAARPRRARPTAISVLRKKAPIVRRAASAPAAMRRVSRRGMRGFGGEPEKTLSYTHAGILVLAAGVVGYMVAKA